MGGGEGQGAVKGGPARIPWVSGSVALPSRRLPGPSRRPRTWEGGPSATSLLWTPPCSWVFEQLPWAPSHGLALASTPFHSQPHPQPRPSRLLFPQGPPLAFL